MSLIGFPEPDFINKLIFGLFSRPPMLTDEEKGGKMKEQRNFKVLFSCNGLAGKSQSFETGALRDGILPEKQKKRFAWCVVPLTLLVCMGIVAMTAAVAAAGGA